MKILDTKWSAQIDYPGLVAVRGASIALPAAHLAFTRPFIKGKGAELSLLVVGSVALDTIETPTGRMEDALGGSATHFSFAASLFTDVSVVGVVGEDFPNEHLESMKSKSIDVSGIEVIAGGRTFRWEGKYRESMNERDTISLELNVFAEFNPVIPKEMANSEYLFLANGSPHLQKRVLEQMNSPRLTVCDTMDHWINDERGALWELLGVIDGVVLNDEEARLLTKESNLVNAGRKILESGPKFVVIKKGEHGAMLISGDDFFAIPAFPSEQVIDPTGAGDSFAGGMMGYLAEKKATSVKEIKPALACGTVVASFNIEDFGPARLQQITRDDVEQRLEQFREMLSF